MVRLIFNPVAGNGQAKAIAEQAFAFLREQDLACELAASVGRDSIRQLAAEAADQTAAGVVVVGGDGSLREAVEGVCQSDSKDWPWLSAIPAGSGSDFLRAMRGSLSVAEHIKQATSGALRLIDVGVLQGADGNHHFINIASAGLSGAVDRLLNRDRTRAARIPGALRYFTATLRALTSYTPVPIEIEVDGERHHFQHCLTVAVANGQYFGGGMKISPRAVMNDGLLEVTVIESSIARSLMLTLPLYRGSILEQRGVTSLRGTRVTLSSTERVLADVDGEALCELPLTLSLSTRQIEWRG